MQFYLCWPGSLLAIVTTILINMCFSFMYLDGVFECCKVSVDVRGVDGDFSKAACGASFLSDDTMQYAHLGHLSMACRWLSSYPSYQLWVSQGF